MQEDFVPIILRCLQGEASREDKEQLIRFLEESEENRRFYSLFAANWSLHESVSSDKLPESLDAMMARLDARIDAAESRGRKRPGRLYYALASAAAALVIIFAVGSKVLKPSAPAIPMETACNITEETMHRVLEDGTQVYLAPGASLSYNVSNLPDRRELTLEGDAYFDVSHDESRPFTVHASHIGVRVLGTAFSVSSSPGQSQVVLERGSVRLLSPEGAAMVTLSPNQKATFKAMTGDLRVEPVFATSFVTDKYRLVSMSGVTVKEMVARLSKIFGVRITCKGDAAGKRYNLAFLKSDSLEDVVSIVEYMTGADCTINH